MGNAALATTRRGRSKLRWILGGYALSALLEAARVGRSEGLASVPVVWAIFPVLHAAHGAGFAAGLVQFALRPDWGAVERLSPSGAERAPERPAARSPMEQRI